MNQYRRRIVFILSLAALMLVAPRISQAVDPQEKAISGVTDFLLDRANDNYIYIFQRKLESNELMKKYLPATLRVAKAGDLRALLTNTELWEEAFNKDKEKLGSTVLKELGTLINDKWCPKDLAADLKEACDNVKGALTNAGKGEVKFHERSSLNNFRSTPDTKSALTDLKNDLEQIEVAKCAEVKKGSYTGCAIQINLLLDAFARANKAFSCYAGGIYCPFDDFDDLDDFRRFVLFFAQMADVADTKESARINVLLKSVTVPPVSFGIKREPHRRRVLITSYLGAAWVGGQNETPFVLAAPVGIEFSLTRDSGNSLSFMFSPFDFGYPLSLKLSDVDARAQISDILVPAAYILYGRKKYPLAYGLGYQYVRSVDTPDKRDGRWLVFLSFDMPLFKLH